MAKTTGLACFQTEGSVEVHCELIIFFKNKGLNYLTIIKEYFHVYTHTKT